MYSPSRHHVRSSSREHVVNEQSSILPRWVQHSTMDIFQNDTNSTYIGARLAVDATFELDLNESLNPNSSADPIVNIVWYVMVLLVSSRTLKCNPSLLVNVKVTRSLRLMSCPTALKRKMCVNPLVMLKPGCNWNHQA